MEFLNNLVNQINGILWSVWVLIPLMIIVGIYFTVGTKGVQFRLLPDMFKAITKQDTDLDENAITPFEAFIVGIASRVGTGNLAGVAIAISIGGPGAVFWMWVVALMGSASAFAESTLAQLYKVHDEETKYRGGPAYYMRDAIGSKKMGATFAVLITLCFGLIFNALQANTIAGSLVNSFDIAEANQQIFVIGVGILLAGFTAYVLFKGSHMIANVSKVIVPIMAISYVAIAVLIILFNLSELDDVFKMIIDGAFNTSAAAGGISGALINGIKRGLFSNEAGMGSAPNAAASADTKHPVLQGLIQSLGVFVDTLIICSATAFIILVSGVDYTGAEDGIALTGDAMAAILGDWSLYYLAFAVFCFAFSSILGNYFYAQSNVEFLGSDAEDASDSNAVRNFKLVVVAFIFFGSVAGSSLVWNLADVFMGLMAVLNLIAIMMLSSRVFLLLNDYMELKKANKPIKFDASKYEETKHLDIWSK